MRSYLSLVVLLAAISGCHHDSSGLPNPGGNQKIFDPCAAKPLTGFDPASKGLAVCCKGTGPAHCVPKSQIIDRLASVLGPCPSASDACMPDPIIKAGGTFVPKPCVSSVGKAAGVCLSQCIPLVSSNPQSAILGQDGCGEGELCIPCLNPISGAPTGACEIIAKLCSPDDGGVGDGGGDGGMACPYKGPPLIDPATLAACAPTCGGAHCLPASLVPMAQQSLLTACNAKGGTPGFCAPDTLITTGGNYVPPTCKSVGGAEGRCLSTCLPSIAAQSALLPKDTCADGEKCAPCFNPIAADPTTPTGACNLACDKPAQPPLMLTCPWKGPPLVDPATFPDCAPACAGAHCVPSANVPPAQQKLLAACPGGFCAPDGVVVTGGNFVPKSCTSIAGAEGRCLSTCLPSILAQSALLPKDVCADGEKCAPCFNPAASDPTLPTGACSIGCDKPALPPTMLSCPYSGPPVIDPASLPECAPTCGGAHCLPAAAVPAGEQKLLATCPGGFCAPDAIIKTGGKTIPASCTSVAGAEGRCLSVCLPVVAQHADLLPQATCAADERCAPCYNPTAADPTAPTGACSIGCDMPKDPPTQLSCPWTGPPVVDPTKFPACAPACAGAHCLPTALVPVAQRALLAPCDSGFCAPDPIISSDNHFVPASCTSIAGAEGRCLSTCLPIVAAQANLLPQSTCAADERCAPCYNPTATDPTAPTGACSLACDAPKNPPTILTCPWTGPAVVDPAAFPACAPACGGSHCLPAAQVPVAQRSLLAACPGGFCAPDPIISTGGNYVPPSCIAFNSTPSEGRCLTTCLPSIAAQSSQLHQHTCTAGNLCAPCYDPFNGNDTGACRLACDKPANAKYTFPACCSNQATCVPTENIPSGQQGNLNQDSCNSGLLCVPNENLPGGSGGQGCNGTFIGFPYSGTCISRCARLGLGGVFGTGNCPSNHACIPCGQAPAGSPGC